MALEPSLTEAPMAPPPDEIPEGSLAADAGRAALAGTSDLGAQAVGGYAELAGSKPGEFPRELQDRLNEVTTTVENSMSPKNRRAGEAQIFPGKTPEGEEQPSFFESPVRSTIMKGARLTPMLLGSLLLPQGWAGVAAGSTFFGTQGVTQQLNDSRKQIMSMSDEELQQRSPVYRDLRGSMDEGGAREELLNASNDVYSMLLAGGAGAIGGGAVGHALRGQAVKGVLGGARVGAADALIGGGVQAAGADVAQQRSRVKAGLQGGLDTDEAVLAALNGGVAFVPVGAGFGAMGQMGRARAETGRVNAKAKDRSSGMEVDPNGPNPAQQAAVEETFTQTDTGKTSETKPPAKGALDQQIAVEEQRLAATPQGPETIAPPPQTSPAPVTPPPTTPAPTTPSTGLEKLGGMAKGMTDRFYDQAFEALQRGETRVAKVREPILEALLPRYQAGEIKSPADVRAAYEAQGQPAPAVVAPPPPVLRPQLEPISIALPKVISEAPREHIVQTVVPGLTAEPPIPTLVDTAKVTPAGGALVDIRALRMEAKDIMRRADELSIDQIMAVERKVSAHARAAYDRWKKAHDAGDLEGMRRHDSDLERLGNIAADLQTEVAEKEHHGALGAAEVKPENVSFAPPKELPPEAARAESLRQILDEGEKAPSASEAPREVASAEDVAKHTATPSKKPVVVEKRKPRVLRTKESIAEAAAREEAREALRRQENARASDAERKRQERAAKVDTSEERARKVIEDSHPAKDSEELGALESLEDAAMAPTSPGTENAREQLLGRINSTIAAAENAGVRIPRKTFWSRELQERGERNPTPFTSRLTELKRLVDLLRAARHIEDPLARDKRVRELFQDHVVIERALRAGDLEEASKRRLATNERLDAWREQSALKAHMQSLEDVDVDDERPAAQETRKGKADHYKLPEEGVRHSNGHVELDQLIHEFGQIKSGRQAPRAQLIVQILKKLKQVAGDTEIHFANSEHLPLGMENADGLFLHYPSRTLAEGVRGDIWIDNRVVDTIDGPRVIIHEMAHAALSHAIEKVPGLKADIQKLMAEIGPEMQSLSHDPITTDPHEFMSEVLSNPRLQSFLINKPAPGWMRREWNLTKPMSMWRAFVTRITRALGLGENHVSLMDAALHLADRGFEYEPPVGQKTAAQLRDHSDAVILHDRLMARLERPETKPTLREDAERMAAGVRANVPHYTGSIRDRVRGALQKMSFFDTLTQQLRPLVNNDKPTELSRLMGRMAADKRIIESERFEPVMRRGAELESKYSREQFRDFSDFLLNETMANVDAAKPLAKQKNIGWQGQAMYPELASTYAKLPKDLRDWRDSLHATFRGAQNEAHLATLKAIVRAANDGIDNDALAQRIFDKKTTDAEREVLKRAGLFTAIRNARMLNKTSGPYVPLMRHGEHVVSGTYRIATPAGAERLNADGVADPRGDIFQFKSKAEAQKFAGEVPAKVLDEKRVYVDKSGSIYDNPPEGGDGKRFRYTKEDATTGTAEERWRVRVQPRYLEFFENEVHARQRHAELQGATNETTGDRLLDLDGVAPKRWEPTGQNATFLSHEFDRALNSLRQQNGFRALPDYQKRELEMHLRDAALAAMGPTRPHSRHIARTYVAGASSDIMKGLTKYSSTMAGFLSRQKYRPKIDSIMKELVDYEHAYRYEDTSRTYPRGQLIKELQQRIYSVGEPESYGLFTRAVNRVLQISQLDKLASPAYHVINSMEPWTVSLPVLAGRYGIGRTLAAMNAVYRDIGAGTVLKQGVVNTGRALRSTMHDADYTKPIMERLKRLSDGRHLQDVMKEMHDIGLISADAGMEFRRLTDPSSSRLGRGLDRADYMARQMGTAIESINRAVTGLAAYRLEYARTKDHAAAKALAIETVINTMGDYAGWNAAPAFNHPLGRLALQFKKYAAKTYTLLGRTAAAALRGDREAMRQFAGIMGTHTLLAGMLGLPLEAVKAGMLAANLSGATDSNYGDVEQWARRQAAGLLGNAGGEIAMRGLPRYLGVDLSTRVGLENLLLPFGDPKSRKPQDLMAYGAQAFAGAPLSMLAEYPAGMAALMNGDMVEAARALVPLKTFADALQAYQKATVGKQTPSGRQSMTPYSPGEAALKVLGFTPGREAETSEMRAAIQGDQARVRKQRSDLVKQWVGATPNQKTAAWGAVQKWNATQPQSEHITMADLTANARRREKEKASEDHAYAVHTSRRERHLRQDNSFYNVP